VCDLETSRIGAPYIYDISNPRVKRQVINLRSFCVLLVDSVESMMMHGLTNPKFVSNLFLLFTYPCLYPYSAFFFLVLYPHFSPSSYVFFFTSTYFRYIPSSNLPAIIFFLSHFLFLLSCHLFTAACFFLSPYFSLILARCFIIFTNSVLLLPLVSFIVLRLHFRHVVM